MTAYWIGYLAIALVLAAIRAVIDDGARDWRIACLLCGAIAVALVILVVGGRVAALLAAVVVVSAVAANVLLRRLP